VRNTFLDIEDTPEPGEIVRSKTAPPASGNWVGGTQGNPRRFLRWRCDVLAILMGFLWDFLVVLLDLMGFYGILWWFYGIVWFSHVFFFVGFGDMISDEWF